MIGDPIENLARATWDLATSDVSLATTFLDAYERSADVELPLARLRAYIVLDLLVIWEYGIRQAPPWFNDPTFEVWVNAIMLPVDHALGAPGFLRGLPSGRRRGWPRSRPG